MKTNGTDIDATDHVSGRYQSTPLTAPVPQREAYEEMMFYAAQLLGRIEADLHRLRGVLLDMRAQQQEMIGPCAAVPAEPPQEMIGPCAAVPAEPPPRRPKNFVRNTVLRVLDSAGEGVLAVQDILAAARQVDMHLTMEQVRPCLSNLKADGLVMDGPKGHWRRLRRHPALTFRSTASLLLCLALWCWPLIVAAQAVGAPTGDRFPQGTQAPPCCTYDAAQNFTCDACSRAEMQRWLGFLPEGPHPALSLIGDRMAWSPGDGDTGGPGAQFRVACVRAGVPFGDTSQRVVPWDREPSTMLSELQPPLVTNVEWTCAVRREDAIRREAGPWSPPRRFMVRP